MKRAYIARLQALLIEHGRLSIGLVAREIDRAVRKARKEEREKEKARKALERRP